VLKVETLHSDKPGVITRTLEFYVILDTDTKYQK